MKKLLIAFSMVGAVALIASAEDAGSQPNSVTTNYAHAAWFSASASGETINPVGGSFSTKSGSESTIEANESKIEFDSEISDPVSFKLDTGTASKTTDLTRIEFELDASVVSTLPDLHNEEVKTAFALGKKNGDDGNDFYAWVGNEPKWTALRFETIPTEDSPYGLTMRFNGSKVQFSVVVNNVTNESAWLTCAALSSKPQIDFVGCGNLTRMNADQVWVVSSEVVIKGGGSVTIAKEDESAMAKLVTGGEGAATIEEVLAAPVTNTVTGGAITISESCKLSTAEAYAIGLIAKDANDTMVAKADGTFKVKADAQASVSGGIPVGFVTPLTPNDSTAAVTYTLTGSADGTAYSPIKDMTKTDINDIKIPTSEITGGKKYRYFKVVTTVTLKDAQ